MTYDNWKTTDPNDQYLGSPVDTAWRQFEDGEITLSDMGEVLLEAGYHPIQVRKMLSKHVQFPVNYFGREE